MVGEERPLKPAVSPKSKHRRRRTKNNQIIDSKSGQSLQVSDGHTHHSGHLYGQVAQTDLADTDTKVQDVLMDLSPADRLVKRKHKAPSQRPHKTGTLPRVVISQYSKQLSYSYSDVDDPLLKWLWWLSLIALTGLAVATRFHNISQPAHICWDETHFGKMGSWYINRTFFFDVHPPLGKMLIGFAGKLTGYNGSFAFKKPGDKYGDVPYVGMRMFSASLGSMLVPFCFCISWELSYSLTAASLAALLVITDTGTLTLSQYILLDPILLFFIMGATFSVLKFKSSKYRDFTFGWWFWLTATGAFLAFSISVKFVGLFVVVFIGLTTIHDLWNLLGDMSNSVWRVVQHFLARAVCLMLLPVFLYMVIFYLHFMILCKSGTGDSFFSSAFQSQLEGNPLYNAFMPEDVAYGSLVTIKNHRTGGAYLHSHWHLYPEGVGARQQQVTTYGHKDENNQWLLKRAADEDEDAVSYIHHGDLVQLEHVSTKRNLHSHQIPAPLTQRHYQVTCYGANGTGDANDVFRVEIVGGKAGDQLKTVRSQFKLIHVNAACALHSHNRQLPKWGFEQFEVTCNPNLRDYKNRWNIEEVFDERLPNSSFQVYAPSFLQKFIESHAVMIQGNSGLKPKEGEVLSLPWQWPLNYRGQPFSGGDYRVYLLGNPVTWWGTLVMIALYCWLAVYHAVREKRGYATLDPVKARLLCSCGWAMLGWLLHYVPFWSMGRILYFHHYFPALLYSFVTSAMMMEYMMISISERCGQTCGWVVYHIIVGLIISVMALSFYTFSPLSYGMHGTLADHENSTMSNLRWLDSWDI